MCKERKKTTHKEIGEEDIHHHIYIYNKDKHNVCKCHDPNLYFRIQSMTGMLISSSPQY